MPSMPPCPWCRTAGTFAMGVFSPCWVTSQTGPTFSVTSMRPSGRNATRHGRLNVATCVMVNGTLGSGFRSPALICASARVETRASSSAVGNFVIDFRLRFRPDRAYAIYRSCASVGASGASGEVKMERPALPAFTCSRHGSIDPEEIVHERHLWRAAVADHQAGQRRVARRAGVAAEPGRRHGEPAAGRRHGTARVQVVIRRYAGCPRLPDEEQVEIADRR